MSEHAFASGIAAQFPADGASASTAAEAVRVQFDDLLNRYEQSIFAFLVTMLGDRDRAKDCAQDTFLRAYQNLCKGKPVNVQWLFKVARNRAVDSVRRAGRERVSAEPLDEVMIEEFTPTGRTMAVQRALLKLSPDDREILYLHEVDGFTSYAIAEMLDIRAGAVRMRLCRAHVRFRQVYEA